MCACSPRTASPRATALSILAVVSVLAVLIVMTMLLSAPARAEQGSPVVSSVTVGAPDATTGVVTGSISATSPDRSPLLYTAVAASGKGSVTVNADGTFSYTPTSAARRTAALGTASPADASDSFTVTVADGHGGTVQVPVTVRVSPANAAPAARATVSKPNRVTGVVTGRVTAIDPEGDPLTFSYTSPRKGTVTISPTGAFTYTPRPNPPGSYRYTPGSGFTGTDSFTVTVADSGFHINLLTVVVPTR